MAKPRLEELRKEGDWIIYKTIAGVSTWYNTTTKETVYKANYKRPKTHKQRFNRQRLSATNLKEAKAEVMQLKEIDKKSITNTKLDKFLPLKKAYKKILLSSPKVKEKDFDDYTKYAYHVMSYFENHLEKEFGNKQVGRITDADLERMGEMLNRKGLSQSVLTEVKGILKRVLQKYADKDLFSSVDKSAWTATNYKKGISLSFLINRINKTAIQIQKELVKALDVLDIPFYKYKSEELRHIKTVIKLSIATGRRVGELIKLPIRNIDFNTGIITVYSDMTKTDVDEVYLAPIELLKEIKDNKQFNDKKTLGTFKQTHTYSKHYQKCLKKVLSATDEELQGKAIHQTRKLLVTALTDMGVSPIISDALFLSHSKSKNMLHLYNVSGSLIDNHKKILIPFWKEIGLI